MSSDIQARFRLSRGDFCLEIDLNLPGQGITAKGVRDISVFPIRVFMFSRPFRIQSLLVWPLVQPGLAACLPVARAYRS